MLITDITVQLDYELNAPSHFQMRLRPLNSARQKLMSDEFKVLVNGSPVELAHHCDADGQWQQRFEAAAGKVSVHYQGQTSSQVDRDLKGCRAHSVQSLSPDLLPWLTPSRYCEADQLITTASQLFGNGGNGDNGVERVQQVMDWVKANIAYEVGASHSGTTAHDTFKAGKGVCRDFAHLGIAFCRALNLPARMVGGYFLFDTPPQDFHALIEVWLGRWVRYDPTGMADPDRVLAVAQGRDAADIAFATIFGPAQMVGMDIAMIERDADSGATIAKAIGQPILTPA